MLTSLNRITRLPCFLVSTGVGQWGTLSGNWRLGGKRGSPGSSCFLLQPQLLSSSPSSRAPDFTWTPVTLFLPLPLQVKCESSFPLLVVAVGINIPYCLLEATYFCVNNHFIKKVLKNPSCGYTVSCLESDRSLKGGKEGKKQGAWKDRAFLRRASTNPETAVLIPLSHPLRGERPQDLGETCHTTACLSRLQLPG